MGRLPYLSEQTVLRREQARGHARGRVDLRVDVLDVVARGLRSDDELAGNLLARQPARKEAEYVDLAGRQACRPLPAPADLVPGGLENRVDRVRVELPRSDVAAQLC